MKKITFFTTMILVLTACSAWGMTDLNTYTITSTTYSDDIESRLEREMLSDITYLEEDEEVDLDFNPYFYLPQGFNPYFGMKLDLNDINYMEIEEYSFVK